MTFDLGALTDRFRRAAERPIVTPGDPGRPTPAGAGRGRLADRRTALRGPGVTPAVTPLGGAVYSEVFEPTPEAAGRGPAATGSPPLPRQAARLAAGGPTSGRRPRRRRWTMPSSPAERQAEAVDPPPTLYRCPTCGKNHQPVRLEGAGIFAPYRRVLVRDSWADGRPRPIGEDGDTSSLIRDGFRPWHRSPAAEAVAPPLTLRERIAGLWYGDEA